MNQRWTCCPQRSLSEEKIDVAVIGVGALQRASSLASSSRFEEALGWILVYFFLFFLFYLFVFNCFFNQSALSLVRRAAKTVEQIEERYVCFYFD